MVALVVSTDTDTDTPKTEIIKENFETKVCDDIQGYPHEYAHYSAGSTWDDGKVIVCGGWIWPRGGSLHDLDECYSLENGYWKLNSQKLKTGRNRLAASNIGNSIWITGNEIQMSQ